LADIVIYAVLATGLVGVAGLTILSLVDSTNPWLKGLSVGVVLMLGVHCAIYSCLNLVILSQSDRLIRKTVQFLFIFSYVQVCAIWVCLIVYLMSSPDVFRATFWCSCYLMSWLQVVVMSELKKRMNEQC